MKEKQLQSAGNVERAEAAVVQPRLCHRSRHRHHIRRRRRRIRLRRHLRLRHQLRLRRLRNARRWLLQYQHTINMT